jgi:hypothetical protein
MKKAHPFEGGPENVKQLRLVLSVQPAPPEAREHTNAHGYAPTTTGATGWVFSDGIMS